MSEAAVDVEVPALGMAMSEATIVAWLKQPGEHVEFEEPLVEIETEKSTVEVGSPAAGTLGPHLFDGGAVVPVGAILARVYKGRVEPEAGGAAPPAPPLSTLEVSGAGGKSDRFPERAPHRLTPRQRREAAEAAEAATPDAPARRSARDVIASRVSESWKTIPHFTLTSLIDVEATQAALQAYEDERRPGITDVLIRALALSLPAGNGDAIGLAVATSNGVAITVIRDIFALPLDELSEHRRAAVTRAQSGRLEQRDLQPVTATLSNLGPLSRVDQFSGIIPLHQHFLLTVGRVHPRLLAVDGAPAVRTSVYATLNVDHRAHDGDTAAAVLDTFARTIGDPSLVLKGGQLR